jgi:hypothetical protein
METTEGVSVPPTRLVGPDLSHGVSCRLESTVDCLKHQEVSIAPATLLPYKLQTDHQLHAVSPSTTSMNTSTLPVNSVMVRCTLRTLLNRTGEFWFQLQLVISYRPCWETCALDETELV